MQQRAIVEEALGVINSIDLDGDPEEHHLKDPEILGLLRMLKSKEAPHLLEALEDALYFGAFPHGIPTS